MESFKYLGWWCFRSYEEAEPYAGNYYVSREEALKNAPEDLDLRGEAQFVSGQLHQYHNDTTLSGGMRWEYRLAKVLFHDYSEQVTTAAEVVA